MVPVLLLVHHQSIPFLPLVFFSDDSLMLNVLRHLCKVRVWFQGRFNVPFIVAKCSEDIGNVLVKFVSIFSLSSVSMLLIIDVV